MDDAPGAPQGGGGTGEKWVELGFPDPSKAAVRFGQKRGEKPTGRWKIGKRCGQAVTGRMCRWPLDMKRRLASLAQAAHQASWNWWGDSDQVRNCF